MNEIGSKVSDVMQLAKLKSYIDKKIDEKGNKILIILLCAIFALLAIAGAVVVFLSVFKKKHEKNYAMYDEGFYDFDDGPCYYPDEDMQVRADKKSGAAEKRAKADSRSDAEAAGKCKKAETMEESSDKCEATAEQAEALDECEAAAEQADSDEHEDEEKIRID